MSTDMLDIFRWKDGDNAWEIRTLSADETLFSPGHDSYFYIVESGSVGIYAVWAGTFRRRVWAVSTAGFLGEGVFFWKLEKHLLAQADADWAVVRAISEDTIRTLKRERPEQFSEALKHILCVTNARLDTAARELGLVGDILQAFSETEIEARERLTKGLLYTHRALDCHAIILVEAHPIIPDLWSYMLDTRFPQTRIAEKAGTEIESLKSAKAPNPSMFRNISHDMHTYKKPLTSIRGTGGYLLLFRKTAFDAMEERVIEHLSPLLSSVFFAARSAR